VKEIEPDFQSPSIAMSRVKEGSNSVLLAFPPKAAGTFVKLVLKKVLPNCCLVRGSITPDDQSLNSFNHQAWITATSSKQYSTVVGHIHFTPTEGDAELMKSLGIAPILMKRNIADSLLSMHEMVLIQDKDPAFREDKRNEMPQFGSAGPVKEYLRMTEDQQKDFLIYNFAPWFFKYYSSWEYIRVKTGLQVLQLDFDAFRTNEVGTITRILKWSGIDTVNIKELSDACLKVRKEGTQARYSHGISGRGQRFFDFKHFAHLQKLAMPYQYVDFENRGIVDITGDLS